MKMSESIDQLAAALAIAQGEISNAKMDAVNPHFRSKYATLASIIDTAKPALAKNGLAVSQVPTIAGTLEGSFVLVTMLTHKGGQYICSEYPINPDKQTPQGVGSAITYARRYALAAMLGIAADEDDDGNAASGNGANGNQRQQAPPQRQSAPPKQQPAQQPKAEDNAQRNALLGDIRAAEEDLDLNANHQANARMKYAGSPDLTKCATAGLTEYLGRLNEKIKEAAQEAVPQN